MAASTFLMLLFLVVRILPQILGEIEEPPSLRFEVVDDEPMYFFLSWTTNGTTSGYLVTCSIESNIILNRTVMIMNTLMLNGTLNMYDSGTTLNCCIIVDSETSDEDIICVQAKIHEGNDGVDIKGLYSSITVLATVLVVTGGIALVVGIMAVITTITFHVWLHCIRKKDAKPTHNQLTNLAFVQIDDPFTERSEPQLIDYITEHNTSQETTFHSSNEFQLSKRKTTQDSEQLLCSYSDSLTRHHDVIQESSGYLIGAMYQPEYELESQTSYYKANTLQVENAIPYVSMENIKGEITGAVDYENVTVIMTKQLSDESSDGYVNEDETPRMNQAPSLQFSMSCHECLNESIEAKWFNDTKHRSTASLKSCRSYENFDPKKYKLGADQKIYENTFITTKVNIDAMPEENDSNLYMNLPSIHQRSLTKAAMITDDFSADYGNITPGMYNTSHLP